jgi:threonine aldolase
VWFEVSGKLGTPKEVAEKLKANGVLVAPLGTNVIRAVTHLDVTREQCLKAADAIGRLAR